MKFSDLQTVNSAVNNKVEYATDQEQYNKPELWCVADRIGDCEDYALAKLHKLLELGWPIEKLCLATAWCENDLGYHAVLVVRDATDEENGYTGDYVLDNRSVDIYQPQTGFLGNLYKWDKIQKIGGSKEWVKASY